MRQPSSLGETVVLMLALSAYAFAARIAVAGIVAPGQHAWLDITQAECMYRARLALVLSSIERSRRLAHQCADWRHAPEFRPTTAAPARFPLSTCFPASTRQTILTPDSRSRRTSLPSR